MSNSADETAATQPQTPEAFEPPHLPVPRTGWQVLAVGIIAVVITALANGAAFATVFVGFFIGLANLFVGVPYGLVALVLSTRWARSIRRTGTAEYNRYSDFTSYAQVYGLAVNLVTAVLGLCMIISYVTHVDGLFLGLLWSPIAGLGLIIASFYTMLNRRAVAGEVYALEHKLPSARLIRVALVSRWVTYLLVIAFLIIFWLSGGSF